jgi:hypothetical protein
MQSVARAKRPVQNRVRTEGADRSGKEPHGHA